VSEQPQGPGWWLASDGKYYPPQAAPVSGPSGPTVTETHEQPPAKKPWYKRWWVIGLLILLAIIVIASLGGGDNTDPASPAAAPAPTAAEAQGEDADPSPEPSQQEPEQTEEAEAPPDVVTIPGTGIFEVGTDVQPGIYYGTSDGLGYWARLKNASGNFNAIIANANPTGQAVVEIKKSDGFFETNGIDEWRPVSELPKDPKPGIPGDGVWIVGVQVQPGTYKGVSEGLGYWARLKDASGEFDAIIANENPEGPSVVEIAPTDAFFETSGVSGWKKTG
jgi:hypothetical protein